GASDWDHGNISSNRRHSSSLRGLSADVCSTDLASTTFNLTGGDTQGTIGTVTYSGFTAAPSETVTGASDWDHGNKTDNGITFASVSSVTGTGSITNATGTTFNLTGGDTQGTISDVTYSGFTAANNQTVTGASDWDHGDDGESGVTFDSVSSVTGTGSITNAASTTFNMTGGNTQGTISG